MAGSSRRARRRRRHARYGKPVYPVRVRVRTRGLSPSRVIYDEWDGAMSVAPGAFAGQDGQDVPVSAGGLGGPRIGEAVLRAVEDGVLAEMSFRPADD